ncbi:Blp family class II bacteriocin [Bacillus sp. SKDU12]|uniref:Blp family class II bacteriocin n=1 Tax=Bacillus sp. SKDU12 TaxID=1337053 RepID=UPI00138A0A0A|nr:hypothetical protein BTW01_18425 [Bacillus sp. SKDU12]
MKKQITNFELLTVEEAEKIDGGGYGTYLIRGVGTGIAVGAALGGPGGAVLGANVGAIWGSAGYGVDALISGHK